MSNTNRVFWWSLIVALGGFLFGFDTAVISGVEQSIQQLFQLNDWWHGFTISSALIGTVLGALYAGKPSDQFGSKKVLVIIAMLYTVSAVGSALANDLWVFIAFRFLGGLAVGGSSVAGPMYISEISPANVRGKMTALFQFNVIFGILMAYVSNYLLSQLGDEPWRWMLGVEAIPSFAFFVLLFWIPQSPRYLVKIGNTESARAVLNMINGANVERELQEIKAGLTDSKTSEKRLFTKNYRRPIWIAVSVAMFNQFSGINAILYFAPRIFELAGLSQMDAMFQPIMIGVANALFTILGMMVIDKVGRKALLIVGSLGMSICLGLIAYSLYFQDFSGLGVLFYLVGYIVFFAFSTGAVIWVLIAEVFPNSVRGKGQALGSFTHWFFAALITFLFPVVSSTPQGGGYSFAFFSLMMVVQALVVWKFYPETKNKTLEELGRELSG